MNAVEILRSDHVKLYELFSDMEKYGKDDLRRREEIFKNFKQLFQRHSDCEEQVFYPLVSKKALLSELIDKSYQAHHFVKVGLEELKILPYKNEKWFPKFLALADSIKAHIHEEEEKVLDSVERLFDKSFLNALAPFFDKFKAA